jgi:AhpD family alkylhydroperoxidase
MTTAEDITPAHYHDPSDKKYIRDLQSAAPQGFAALAEFDNAALRDDKREIPRKYTELMALAVALTTQCAYCIEGHVLAARREGATEAEVAETVLIAAALRAGGAVAHGLLAMKLYRGAESARGTRSASAAGSASGTDQ